VGAAVTLLGAAMVIVAARGAGPGAATTRTRRNRSCFLDDHLKRLVSLARSDHKSFFERNPHPGDYRHRLLSIALCQGRVALPRLQKDAKKTNDVKDLDVYSFYAADPEISWPCRQHGVADFGEPEFGHHPDKRHAFVGRHVHLMGRALLVEPDANPGLAVCDWLATSNNKTPRLLRKKAVVGLYPARYRGKVIWDPYAKGYR
jgi:hypothetical protein